MKWRKINNVIHRDLGYLCFGLTILYVISGIAVNHIHDWNPTYSITRSTTAIDLADLDRHNNQAISQEVLAQLDEQAAVKNIFRVDQDTLKIFVENNAITLYLDRSEAYQEKSVKRPILYQANFLHLNHAKKFWTWFADAYALALAVLAITGLLVRRGKTGLAGRGAWLSVAGIMIPIFFLWLYS